MSPELPAHPKHGSRVPRAGGDECRRRLNLVHFRRSKSEQILVQFLLGCFVSCSVGISSREMDIGVMESFFALVQEKVLHRKSWATRRELSAAITHLIERTYRRKRRQRALRKLRPIEYGTVMEPAVSIAA